MSGPLFEVVFICTGNRARSPLAEALFRRAAGSRPVAVSSRGILDLGPIPPLAEAGREALRLGLDLSEHRARRLVGSDLAETDLVIGFERMHIVTAVVDAHAARERSFTLPELVPLLEGVEPAPASDPAERARLAVAAAHASRPHDPSMLRVEELADPLGGTPAVFRRTADEIADLTQRLALALFG